MAQPNFITPMRTYAPASPRSTRAPSSLPPARPFQSPGSGPAVGTALTTAGHDLRGIAVRPTVHAASAPIQRVKIFVNGEWVERPDLGTTQEEAFDRLGPEEKWREHIDGRHHQFGREVYRESLHEPKRKKDPRYNEAMMDADRYVRTTLGRPFTVKDYDMTHYLAMPNPNDMGSHFRTGDLPVRFQGFNSNVEDLKNENVSPTPGLPPLVKAYEPDSEHDGERGSHVVLEDVPKRLHELSGKEGKQQSSEEVYTNAIQDILESYHKGLDDKQTPDEKLKHIANTHRSLENLHPYVDANTRTNRLVLNRMLVENGLAPTVLENPLEVHHHTLESWMEQIKTGQNTWASRPSAQNPKMQWRMEAMGNRGRRNKIFSGLGNDIESSIFSGPTGIQPNNTNVGSNLGPPPTPFSGLDELMQRAQSLGIKPSSPSTGSRSNMNIPDVSDDELDDLDFGEESDDFSYLTSPSTVPNNTNAPPTTQHIPTGSEEEDPLEALRRRLDDLKK